jgi:corrinoid protein of di/trimethylamine methyltransferase
MEQLFEEMKNSVLEGEEEEAAELAQKALDSGMDPVAVMDKGFLKGINEAGKLYEEGEFFLPELVCAADAMKAALEVLDEELKKCADNNTKTGKVVLATVQGDVHDIGKTIVGAMMTANGYEVYDLGSDVPNEKVLSAIDDVKPDIVGLSALLTTTMEQQKNVIEMIREAGKRDEVKIMVGGAPVSRQWSEQIGADGYSDNAIDAVKIAGILIG